MNRIVASMDLCRIRPVGRAVVALVLLGAGAASAAPLPCLLVYEGSIKRTNAAGKPDLAESAPEGHETKRFLDNCIGVELVEGHAEAIVRVPAPSQGGGEEERFVRFPMVPHRPIEESRFGKVPPAPFGLDAVIRGFNALFSADPVNAASRGGDNAQILKDMLAGTLVVPPDGLRLPLGLGASSRIESVVVQTETLPRRTVEGVTLANDVLTIPPGALVPDKSYRWQAVVRRADDTTTMAGAFGVDAADAELARRFAARGKGASDPNAALSDAAWYLAHDLKANATIALAQWYARAQLPK